MAKKSTNRGTCQCCGSLQKLPNGRLAKHGYQVLGRGDGGFFSGTCPGSEELPLEISCALVEKFAQQAEDHAKNLRKKAEEDRAADTSQGIGWSYEWQKGEYQFGKYFPSRYVWTANKQHERLHGEPPEYWARTGNQNHAKFLDGQAEGNEKYADRQRETVRKWKQKPLLPLEGKAS